MAFFYGSIGLLFIYKLFPPLLSPWNVSGLCWVLGSFKSWDTPHQKLALSPRSSQRGVPSAVCAQRRGGCFRSGRVKKGETRGGDFGWALRLRKRRVFLVGAKGRYFREDAGMETGCTLVGELMPPVGLGARGFSVSVPFIAQLSNLVVPTCPSLCSDPAPVPGILPWLRPPATSLFPPPQDHLSPYMTCSSIVLLTTHSLKHSFPGSRKPLSVSMPQALSLVVSL